MLSFVELTDLGKVRNPLSMALKQALVESLVENPVENLGKTPLRSFP